MSVFTTGTYDDGIRILLSKNRLVSGEALCDRYNEYWFARTDLNRQPPDSDLVLSHRERYPGLFLVVTVLGVQAAEWPTPVLVTL